MNKDIPQASTTLSFKDKLESTLVRWGIGRMDHTVNPGIYQVGNPDQNSPVLVSANYKLSFDALRKELGNIDAYIMVIDTKGINVWCAAGKGTFGTEEIVNRIKKNELNKIVSHKKIILPQLGAPGVAAHEVQRQTGFRVVYGPVRAADIPEFLRNGMKVTKEMRQVKFSFIDRLHLAPLEIVASAKYLLILILTFLFVSAFSRLGLDWHSTINLLLAYVAGTILGPILLPWLPGRSFALKGIFAGFVAISLSSQFDIIGITKLEMFSWILIMSAISSYLLMNFTGSSTYTSLSGVQKEMKIALPLQLTSVIIGFILWITTKFI